MPDDAPAAGEADQVEEDGDEIFTPMPAKCIRWGCGGSVYPTCGFHVCDKCHCSYGPVEQD